MTPKEYERMSLADMKAKQWITNRDISTMFMTVPKGTVVRITFKRGGLSIETDKCPHCGKRFRAIKVSPLALDEFEPDDRQSAVARIINGA